MGMTMGGMVAGLRGKTGDALDKAFLAEMIPHHQGAVGMANMTIASGKHPELRKFCQGVVTDQTKEIGQMRAMEAKWGYGGPMEMSEAAQRAGVDLAATPPPQRAAARRKLAKAKDALPDGSFPVPDLAYLKKAIRAAGRAPASKRSALKALIRKRAKALGAMNEPGVKGTWAFANDDSEALEMATMTRMPKVRGAADVTVSRSGPGTVTVMHKSTGMKVGTLSKGVAGWQGTHSTGAKTEPSPTMASSLSGLIGMHNKMAAQAPSSEPMAKSYANGEQATLSFATSAATSSDGPRVTSMSAGKPSKAIAPVALSMPDEVKKVYAKLIAKGMKPDAAMALAKRAAAMHAKKTAKAA